MGGCAGKNRSNHVVVPVSKSGKAPKHAPLVEVRSYKHPDIQESANEIAVAELKSAILKNDSWLVNAAFTKYSIKPNESIGNIGYGQTPLHVAAQHNSNNAIRTIIAVIKGTNADDVPRLLAIPDSDGNTPAMVAALHDAPEALATILEFSKNPSDLKNNQGLNLFEIAQNKSQTCLNILNYVFGRKDQISESLKNELLNKQQALAKLEEEAQANTDSSGEADPKDKVDPSKIEAAKIHMQLLRANRTAEDVINAQKLHQNQTSTSVALKCTSILDQLKGKTDAYQDPEFPAHVDSICVNKSNPNYEKYYKTAKWLRPHEFLKVDDYSKIKVFDGIDPNDIQQGIIGVCYFLSSMASIAEFPSRLMKIFNTKEANPNGVYSVTFYNMGIPQEIIVDDRFPCYQWGKPMFSSPKGNELWTMILEKAWAKLYGNYCVTESGWMSEALTSLLGAPSEEIVINASTTPDKVWADISSWDHEKFIMGCSTKANVDLKKTGLVKGHAYSVLAAYDVGGVRLLKLRNPWGKQEWTGDFSDKSPLWTDEAKRIVGYTDADDGIFCMTVPDFIEMMSSYSVCYYKDDYFRSHQLIEATKKNAEYFEFELKETCETCITVMQKDDRFFANKNNGYKASPVELILLKKEGNKFKHISTNNGVWGREVYGLKSTDNGYLELAPGSYVLRIKVRWRDGDKGKYAVVVNSETPFTLTQVKRDKYKDFLKNYLLEKLLPVKPFDIGNNCVFASTWVGIYMGLYVKNDGNGTLNLKVTLKNTKNVRIGKRFKAGEGDTFVFKVPPKGYAVQYLKKIDITGGGSLGWDFDTTYN